MRGCSYNGPLANDEGFLTEAECAKVMVQHNTGTGSKTTVVTTLTIGDKFANFSTVTR